MIDDGEILSKLSHLDGRVQTIIKKNINDGSKSSDTGYIKFNESNTNDYTMSISSTFNITMINIFVPTIVFMVLCWFQPDMIKEEVQISNSFFKEKKFSWILLIMYTITITLSINIILFLLLANNESLN